MNHKVVIAKKGNRPAEIPKERNRPGKAPKKGAVVEDPVQNIMDRMAPMLNQWLRNNLNSLSIATPKDPSKAEKRKDKEGTTNPIRVKEAKGTST